MWSGAYQMRLIMGVHILTVCALMKASRQSTLTHTIRQMKATTLYWRNASRGASCPVPMFQPSIAQCIRLVSLVWAAWKQLHGSIAIHTTAHKKMVVGAWQRASMEHAIRTMEVARSSAIK